MVSSGLVLKGEDLLLYKNWEQLYAKYPTGEVSLREKPGPLVEAPVPSVGLP